MANLLRSSLWTSLILFSFLMAAPARSQQIAYYVSPNGSDNNPGTESRPFQTLAKAQSAVRTVNQTMTQDVTVYLRGGVYSLDQTFLLDARDSGTNGHLVIYKSYTGETAVISGGEKIVGWDKGADGIWQARTDIPDFRQLYVNGKQATRAMGGPPAQIEIYGRDGYKTSDVAMADWKNQADIEFLYDKQWERSICKVAKITRQGSSAIITMQQPYFTLLMLKEGIRPALPNFVANARELLQQPGEWYLDKHAHQLFYMPRPGETMQDANVIAPAVEKLVELRGTLDDPVRNIEFYGITFRYSSWLKPSQIGLIDMQANFIITPSNLIARDEQAVANLHNEYTKSPSSIVLHAARGVRFERCKFTDFGSGGIDMEYGSKDNLLEGNEFVDLAGSAIQIGDVIDHHPKDPREIVEGNRVMDNYIHHVADEYTAGVGIFAGYTSGTLIAHNEISDLPYSGISVGWGWGEEDPGGGEASYFQPFYYQTPTPSRNMLIEYNDVHDAMKLHWDGGGIYTIGDMPGTVIRGNLVHDNLGRPGGIYFDEGSGYIEATGNIVYNVVKAMNYNNRYQNRIATCHVHDNYFNVGPTDANFPKAVAQNAGLEPAYRDLLRSGEPGSAR